MEGRTFLPPPSAPTSQRAWKLEAPFSGLPSLCPAQGASVTWAYPSHLLPRPHRHCCEVPRPALASRHTGLVEQSEQGVQGGGFLGVGRAGCHPLLARALSQGPHCCSQQLGEISAAVGCQFSAGTGLEGRVGSRREECLNWAGLRGEVVCT